jgi:UDP-N-acetylmuramoylalanine--D-glutamate ligase
LKEIKIKGEHNLENVLAAVTLTLVSSLKLKVVRQTIKNFKGVADRLELVKESGKIQYYNDTTATAPEAAVQALKTLGSKKKNIILLAGGADKKLKFVDFAVAIRKYTKAVILFKGTATPRLKKELLKLNYWASAEAKSMSEAVSYANKLAKAGDIVLLSPGCASFGLFINEFDRGEQFKKIIKTLEH